MPNGLKALLFALLGFITLVGVFIGWSTTGIFVEGLKLAGQIILMTVGMALTLGILLWVGFQIFHD